MGECLRGARRPHEGGGCDLNLFRGRVVRNEFFTFGRKLRRATTVVVREGSLSRLARCSHIMWV
jgi:hypothetical protein